MNKVTIVTGASGGIGSKLLTALPGKVIGVDIKKAKNVIALDLSNEIKVKNFYQKLRKAKVIVTGLVNVAGKPGEAAIKDLSLEHWNDVIAANVTTAMLMSRFAIDLMPKGGSIVNFASIASFKGFNERVAYCSAKAAILGLTRSLAVELATKKIRVNAIAPGSIDSPWIDRLIKKGDAKQNKKEFAQRSLLKRLGTTDEIASLVNFLLSDEASFITGAIYPIDGGATAI